MVAGVEPAVVGVAEAVEGADVDHGMNLGSGGRASSVSDVTVAEDWSAERVWKVSGSKRGSFYFLHFVTFDERECPGDAFVVTCAQRFDGERPVDRVRVTGGGGPGLIVEGDTAADRADRHAHLREAVEAAEDGEAEAVVDDVALADQLAVAVDLLDIAFHRAGEERVGKPLARDAQRRVPGGGEDRVAPPGGISAGDGHAGGFASLGDDRGLGEGFAEDRHLLAGPAVVADNGKVGGLRFMRFVFHEPDRNIGLGCRKGEIFPSCSSGFDVIDFVCGETVNHRQHDRARESSSRRFTASTNSVSNCGSRYDGSSSGRSLGPI